MATLTLRIEIDDLPTPVLDDEIITEWIEERLSDAQETFVQAASGSGSAAPQGSRRRTRHSAPGDYPASDTGRLVNSLAHEMTDVRAGRLFSDAEYAGCLARGTSRMAPRRMLGDALSETLSNRPELDKLASAVRFE